MSVCGSELGFIVFRVVVTSAKPSKRHYSGNNPSRQFKLFFLWLSIPSLTFICRQVETPAAAVSTSVRQSSRQKWSQKEESDKTNKNLSPRFYKACTSFFNLSGLSWSSFWSIRNMWKLGIWVHEHRRLKKSLSTASRTCNVESSSNDKMTIKATRTTSTARCSSCFINVSTLADRPFPPVEEMED